MDRTWQRLPISKRLDEPLALEIRIVRRNDRATVDESSHSIVDALEKLLVDLDHPLLVDAGPGGGKTTALRWIARTFAHRILAGEHRLPLPVFVDLGQYAHLTATNLQTICNAELDRIRDINYRAIRDYAGPKLFLLDGLDLLDPALPTSLLDQALNSESDRFVFSTRTNTDIRHFFSDWAQSSCLLLNGLKHDTREEWLSRHIPASAKLRFRAIVKANPFLDKLLQVPLLFVMFVSACVDEGDHAEFDINSLPGRAGIFAGFVDYAVRRAHREHRIEAAAIDRWRDGISVWRAFCFAAMMEGYKDRIPVGEVDRLLEIPDKTRGPSPEREIRDHWRASLRIATASGLIFEDRGHYQFLHQQFAEHFAGLHLADQVKLADEHFHPTLKPVLERQDLDFVSGNALAVLCSHHSTYRLVEQAISWLRKTDNTAACYLLALSGSSLGCALLHLFATNEALTVPARVAAIHALGILPHPHATIILEQLIYQTHSSITELADKAIVSLGAIGTEDAQAVLETIAGSPEFTTEFRLQAMTCGALMRVATVRSSARAVITSPLTSDDALLIVLEILKDVGDMSDVAAVESLARRLDGNVWNFSIKRTLRGITNRSEPLADNALYQSPVSAQLHEDFFAMSRRITETPTELVDVTALDKAVSRGSIDQSPELAMLATVLRTAGKADGRSLRIAQRQLEQLCASYPKLIDILNAYPHKKVLSDHVLASCARASGRRILALPERSAKESKSGKSTQAKKMSAEAVAAAFLAEQEAIGGPMGLRDAEAFSRRIGHPYTHETIRNTKIWQTHFPSTPRERKPSSHQPE